jgi:hypothetical protein
MIGLDKRSDFYVWRVRHPRNMHNYLLILDKVSSSCHLVIGPRKVRIKGHVLDNILTDKDIERLRKLRKSMEIENEKRYEL